MFCYIWSYSVTEDNRADFEAAYGPQGEWATFFRRSPDYIRTDLLHDHDSPERFVTVDHWTSRDSCLAFRTQFAEEFAAIDARCDALTLDEKHLGDFDLVS